MHSTPTTLTTVGCVKQDQTGLDGSARSTLGFGARSQGLRVSGSQGLKVSRSQGLRVSRSQGLKVSRSQGEGGDSGDRGDWATSVTGLKVNVICEAVEVI